jgi:hypothetical protein
MGRFWLEHDWRSIQNDIPYPCMLVVILVYVTQEDEGLEPYCGPANEAPGSLYSPW